MRSYSAYINSHKDIFYEIVKEMLDKDIPLGDIFMLNKDMFRLPITFMKFLNDTVINKYGIEMFKRYLTKFYIKMYNGDYMWKYAEYKRFWRAYGFRMIIENDSCKIFNKLSLDVYNEIDEKFLYIPQYYLDYINNCFKSYEPMSGEKYYYTWTPGKTKQEFINRYLYKVFSKAEIKSYLKKLSDDYFMTHSEISIYNLSDYIFGDQCYHLDKNQMPDIKCALISVNFERVSSNFQTSKIKKIAEKLDLSKKKISEFNESRWFDLDEIKEKWDLYSESEVKILLDYAFEKFNKNREKIAKYRILEQIYNISPVLSRANTSRILDKTRHAVFINRIIKNAYEDQFKYLIETNKTAIDIKSDRWSLYYINKETIGKKVIRFEELPEDIKIDLKMYTRNNCFSKYQISKCQLIIVIIRQIVDRYSIKMTRDISEEILLKWLHVCKSETKYQGNSIRQRIYLLKEFYDYMNTTKKYREDNLKNQAINITIRNVHKNTKHIDYIPPEVRFAIEEHIDELDDMTRIMYLIFSETGLRFGDQVECRVSDVSLDAADVSMARLHFYDNKNKSKRIKKDRYEKRYNNITLELYHKIILYILKTKELRDKYNDDHIFIKENMKGLRCNIRPETITNHINSLITKYNITTAIGEKWHYVNRQMRKSIAVDLITNGASLYNVQTQLYHMSRHTTEIYYAEVDKIKIKQLNTEFFKQKFLIMIGEEKLSYFTEEERKILYLDFLKNHREVELGLCCKHQSEGTCQTLGKNMCASCPKLVTGLKYIVKWEKLYNDSVLRINEMIDIYRKHQIEKEIYNEFKEFKKEVNLSKEYKAVIDAIHLLESETNDK